MSVAEVERYLKGVEWRMKLKAQFDYSLADLIGISAARMVSNDVKFPSIEEVYPNLFKKEEQKQEETKEEIATQNSVNRFLEFAAKHNAKIKKEEGKNYASGTT